jgi:hypothetical protein
LERWDHNSNPFPNVETALDMSALVMNNLGWGWRNVSMVSADAQWSYTEPLEIPPEYPSTATYSIFIAPTGFVGWDAELYASRTDANGNQIRLPRTKVTADGVLLGVSQAVLEPGFLTDMTVNMYSPDGRQVTPGASVPLSCNYVATPKAQLYEAVERGLVDWELMARVRRSIPQLAITPTAWLPQGYYTWTVAR